MEFYGTGIQKQKGLDGVTAWVSVRIPLTETTRVGAVNQANRIAKRDKIMSVDVRPIANRIDTGGILTKSMKKEKELRHRK